MSHPSSDSAPARVRPDVPDVVVITGMSGAGRTEAMHTFEDLGYYVIDNLPPSMLLQLARLVGIDSGVGRHLAVVCDLRSQGLFDEFDEQIQELRNHELTCSVLFLDSDDDTLMQRYTMSRRRPPIAQEGEATIDAIRREREQLRDIKARADQVIDTSALPPKELRRRLRATYSELTEQEQMEVRVFSFGYKYGMPAEADLMIDVRFLPNPYWDPEMRELTGLDERVASFVLDHPQTETFLDAWFTLLDTVMPGYVAEGKAQLSIAVGCTGGQHRSVALAEATAKYLREQGFRVTLGHRDLFRAGSH